MKHLRAGKNQSDIRPKHKNFGKNMICSEKIFVCLRKLRDVYIGPGIFLICPAKFSYFTGKFLVCPEKIFWYICAENFFETFPPARHHFGREILM